MLSVAKCLAKFIQLGPICPYCAKLNLFSKMISNRHQTSIHFYCKSANSSPDFNIVDVNIDRMMSEDDEFASNYNYEPKSQSITTSMDLLNQAIAPIDVNPWIDEELEKGGTVHMELIEKSNEEIHYPEPPKERSGYYEFEGIKIWLPKTMLTPATYRYRLDENDMQTLPDDIRICKFENFKPTS